MKRSSGSHDSPLRAHRAGAVASAVAATVAAAFLCVLVAGCSTSTQPTTPDDELEDAYYILRTTPDSVLANLVTAYQHDGIVEYLDCLAEDFIFYPSDGALAGNEWMPESWGKDEERLIHFRMFLPAGNIIDIDLDLIQIGDPVEIPGATYEDPVMYEYTFGVDLLVMQPHDIGYIATAPSLFVLRPDPDEVGPAGEELWEIFLWYDLDEDGTCGRPVEPVSWGEIKAMYLEIDRQ